MQLKAQVEMRMNGSTSIDKLPTATALQSRLNIFQSTRRPQHLKMTLKQTKFGSSVVNGRLGQSHADLLDCVMFFREDFKIIERRLHVAVDPYRIRKSMGGGKSIYSASGRDGLVTDLKNAELITENSRFEITGRILEKTMKSRFKKEDKRKWGNYGERALEVWVLSVEWTELIKNDIGRFYNPLPLCLMKEGAVAALARHVLTHQHMPGGGWKLDGLMMAVGVERRFDKVRKEMLDNSELLGQMGITFDFNSGRVKMVAAATSPAAAATDFNESGRSRHRF